MHWSFKIIIVLTLILSIGAGSIVHAAPRSKSIEFWNDHTDGSPLKMDYSKWNSLLEKYLILGETPTTNRFNYSAVSTADRQLLDEFLDSMQEMDPRQLSGLEQKAYWLNLYNSALVKQIIESEPKDSVRELGNRMWRRNRLYIAMQKISLDDIEHGVLRPLFGDPRVHFSLVAGTIGSAELLPVAFTAENVEELLEENTRNFLNHERGVRIENGEVTLSTIFRWYKEDFEGNLNGIKNFIMPYLGEDKKQILRDAKSVDYDYDWTVNQP